MFETAWAAGPLQAIRHCIGVLLVAALIAGCGGDDDSPSRGASRSVTGKAAEIGATATEPGEQQARESRPVAGDALPYADVEGRLARGYFAYPIDMIEPLPGVLLIHDWFGLNEEMREVADRIAGRGYIVLAIDLFGGKVAKKRIDAREMLKVLVEQPDAARENVRQAYEFLAVSAGAPRVATVGWGSGGLWSLNTALMFPEELDGAAIIQGQFITDVDRLQALKMPVLGIFGAADRDIPIERVRAFDSALEAASVPYLVRLYPAAGRGFMLQGSAGYSPQQAANAWEELFRFLADNLAGVAR